MNPLFLLLGLFGLGAMGTSSSRSTTTADGKLPPIVDDAPDMDMGGDDDGGMDMGGDDDSGMDMGGDDDGGMDMGGDDDGGMDMGGDDDGGMDMGGDDDGGMDMGGDDDGGMDMGDHGGDDHTPPQITPPGVGASQSAITAYLNDLANLDEIHVHNHDDARAGEHDAAMDLVPRGDASHVAIGSGDWFDPSIWANGEVPGDNANVLIPDGVTVNYAGMGDARLDTVRIDGTLDFATDTNSQMIFDTMVATPTSHLIIGTANDPVQDNVDVDLIVANNGPIDTNWDPMLLSRGIIAHGQTTIHGAEKDSHEKVIEDPMAGDTSVTFAEIPEGWQVGDTIVIAGTHYDGYSWDPDQNTVAAYPNEDEVRVITSIEGGTVSFDEALVHDHDAPRDDLATSVANYTRNVSVETENGADAEVYERGHVMFMHSDEVDVRYAEFTQLGRTDKSVDSDPVDSFASTSFDSNVQGRYSLHLHQTGTSDVDNPTILEGNAVYDSPGWGIVHHDSNALLTNNATFDTFGAGFVAETGNEIGAWVDNIAIFAQGVSWEDTKNTTNVDADDFDTARGGEGFWFQGRMVASYDNVAASMNMGFVYFHRDGDDTMIEFDSAYFRYPDALFNDDLVRADEVPILGFQGNEAFAVNQGLHVAKAAALQGHDVWTHMDDFTAWSVVTGVHLQYTSHYLLTDFDVIGKEDTPFRPAESGFEFGNNMNDVVIANAQIDGFATGVDLHKHFVHNFTTPDFHQYFVVDPVMTNVDQEYANYDPRYDQILTADDLANHAPNLQLNSLYFGADQYLTITGTKYDSIGAQDFPAGVDTFEMNRADALSILDTDGYWTTSSGQAYFLADIYFTDRLTGDVFYETHAVYVDPAVPLGHPQQNGGHWADNIYNGVQDIAVQNGVVMAGDQVLDVAIPAEAGGLIGDTYDSAEDVLNAVQSATSASITLSAMPEMPHTSHDDMDAEMLSEDDLGESMQETAATSTDEASSGVMAVFEAAARVDLNGDEILPASDPAPENDPDDPYGTHEMDEGVTINLPSDLGIAIAQMDTTEVSNLLDEAIDGGLGDRDATITIDETTESVTLSICKGSGMIAVETASETEDYGKLWAALTADQAILDDTHCMMDEEEENDETFLAA